jgi:hypothetical protein
MGRMMQGVMPDDVYFYMILAGLGLLCSEK